MTTTSTTSRERLRMLGQLDLGDWIELGTGEELWSIQRQVATAISQYRAKVAVPSCNASGKTWLAARIVLAFFDSFIPGTPCVICNGPCGGAKIITTSSKFQHLHDNLWGEIRMAYPKAVERIGFDGRMPPSDLRMDHSPNHFMIGQSADKPEGFQGYHAAHKLILGDEATSIDEQAQLGITRLLSSGDSRLLLIFNPTTADTYAANQARSPSTEVIKITAYDTPHFTGEHVPDGANLITKDFLHDLELSGMGPGTYEWETSVMAEFWELGDDVLINSPWIQKAKTIQPVYGARALGIDLASYGSAESVIAVRDGTTVIAVEPFPSMRMDHFFEGPVLRAVKKYAPNYLVYDADGVGAGVIGYAEKMLNFMPGGSSVLGFRGAVKTTDQFRNARSAWYWSLRRRFENGTIQFDNGLHDTKLEEQLGDIHYAITQTGAIQVESKEQMKKRGTKSPDRADALMYAFALADDLPLSEAPKLRQAQETFGVADHSEERMWRKDLGLDSQYDRPKTWELNPVLGVPDDY